MKRLLNDSRIRFLLAGGTAAALTWLIRFPLSTVMPFSVAVVLATAIGMVFGFFTYKHFVFGHSPRPVWRQTVDFIGVNLVGAIVTVIVAVALRELPPWPAAWMHFVEAFAHAGGIAVAAVVNYIGHRHVTFSPHEKPGRPGNST